MASQRPGRDQRNELNIPWPQNLQPQLSYGGASGTFSSWDGPQLPEQNFAGYHGGILGAQRQHLPTHTRYQSSGSAHLVPSSYVTADRDNHLSLPPLHSHHPAEMTVLSDIQDGVNRIPFASRSLSTAIERRNEAFSTATPNINYPTRSTTQRKPRAKQPASEEWDRCKSTIEQLYLKENLSLTETIASMSTNHGFHATEKMYKDKFKQWKWSKNLSRDMALGMLNKAKQRQPKETIFQWGNQTWTTDRIMKKHCKITNDSDPPILERYPTPQGITWETPRVIDVTDSPDAPERAQDNDTDREVNFDAAVDATKNPGGAIDEGRSSAQSIAHVNSILEAALTAEREDKKEEAELGFKDALTCSSRLLSPTDSKTIEIGYLLASHYAREERMADADDLLNRMTNEHCTRFGSSHLKTVAHVLRIFSFLRLWQRNGEADLLIYHLFESQRSPEEYPIMLQNSAERDADSGEMIRGPLTTGDAGRLTNFLSILENLASDPGDHAPLEHLMSQVILRLDVYQNTHGKLVIQARCILAEILLRSEQYDRAKSILRGSGRALKQQVDGESLLKLSTLKLFQRVAFAFLGAKDPETIWAPEEMHLGKKPPLGRASSLPIADYIWETSQTN
ncbi:rhomboid family [Trichoderma arundinaceum]|uniref:Rhomboid family n=1 Tax=Trichoderma arundinaceum TaxID=490622 RepID=A0A395NS88_TRIAR|nr:rhomboid family [Trichoderma arundinaceum]